MDDFEPDVSLDDCLEVLLDASERSSGYKSCIDPTVAYAPNRGRRVRSKPTLDEMDHAWEDS